MTIASLTRDTDKLMENEKLWGTGNGLMKNSKGIKKSHLTFSLY